MVPHGLGGLTPAGAPRRHASAPRAAVSSVVTRPFPRLSYKDEL